MTLKQGINITCNKISRVFSMNIKTKIMYKNDWLISNYMIKSKLKTFIQTLE